ncbi:MAG: ferredoxin--NADP reductase [Nocardia sp.]|nr:ferredoxin--NADP reductase [Nocardia sp.]
MARPPLFQRATVTRIIKETADARTLVLTPHEWQFAYAAGQFCTFKVEVDGRDVYRAYSMSSAPETDTEIRTTVKRVPGGQVSNWMHDTLTEGDEVLITAPTGKFCLRPAPGPFLGFAGGSGITPILSLAKSVLATTDRRVKLLCADRDRAAMIFDGVLSELVTRFPDRLTVVRHIDDENGFPTPELVREFVGTDTDGDSYICGPEPFMAMVEAALPGPGQIFSERFGSAPPPTDAAETTGPVTTAEPAVDAGTVSIRLGRKRASVPRKEGETILESARRAGLSPPFSCEAGNCATCMAKVTDGHATMRVNDALSDDEVVDGYVLTCQAVPDTASIAVHYED